VKALHQLACATCLLTLLPACTVSRNVVRLDGTYTQQPLTDANYTETSYAAMHYLLANVRPPIMGEDAFDATRPILWASCVDLNDYQRTNHFGRLMGESLAIAMQNHRKTKLIHMNLRQSDVPITPAGEFFLTRDVEKLADHFNAGAVLVSSYSVAIDKVYVQVQLINVDQNAVVGAVQFAIPNGPRTMALLRDEQFPSEASSLNYQVCDVDRRDAYR
jgi:hypothetical protein